MLLLQFYLTIIYFRYLLFSKMVTGSWTGTQFPIIHGNYKTDYFGDGQSYNFEFWAIINPISNGFSIYMNGDIFTM